MTTPVPRPLSVMRRKTQKTHTSIHIWAIRLWNVHTNSCQLKTLFVARSKWVLPSGYLRAEVQRQPGRFLSGVTRIPSFGTRDCAHALRPR